MTPREQINGWIDGWMIAWVHAWLIYI